VIVTVPAFFTRLTAEHAVAVFAARADERYVARWLNEPAAPTRTELISETDAPERKMRGDPVSDGAFDATFAAATGVTAADAADDGDEPAAFSAVAVNVYAVPFVSPSTVHDVAGGVIAHVRPPGLAVTV
jgi:hypothetical protein